MPGRPGRHWLAALMASALVLAACRPSTPDPEPPASVAPDTVARSDAEYTPGDVDAPPWLNPLSADIAEIDAAMPGRFGAYVRRLGADPGSLDMGHERAWYLSSTIKVPVAIAILEQVDAGELSLDEEIELRQEDFVDGSGDMISQQPGQRFTIAALLEKSLRDSDSVATDMLIRRIGEVDLNRRIREWLGRGFGQITTILQVRYDAYGALHPGVAKLTNMDIMSLRHAPDREGRLQALAGLLGVERADLDAESLEEVFRDYYESGANSAPLEMFADMLEMVVTGELLSPESTQLLLDHMRNISTGTRRIQAGLPAGTDFAQKTGTQIERACNVGVINPGRVEEGATIVVACADDFGDIGNAEQAFQALGRALAEAGLD